MFEKLLSIEQKCIPHPSQAEDEIRGQQVRNVARMCVSHVTQFHEGSPRLISLMESTAAYTLKPAEQPILTLSH